MEYSILNLNIWLLPFRLSRSNYDRRNRFVELVKTINPDIITLQEVWLRRDVTWLEENLKGYHSSRINGHKWNKSGLLTFTKSKPLKHEFHAFPIDKKFNFVERVARKGVLITKLKDITIANTHFYSPIFRGDLRIASKQFEMVVAIPNVDILSGDFNITELTLQKWNRGRLIINPGAPTLSSDNPLRHKRINRHRSRKIRIDFTVAKKESNFQVSTITIKRPAVSDHYAIFSVARKPYKGPKTSKKT